MTQTVLAAAAAVLLLALLFFISMADAALRALNQLHLRRMIEQGVKRADAMRQLLDHPRRIVSTTLIVHTFALAALAALTAVTALDLAPGRGLGRTPTIATVLVVGLLVITFGQLIPRTLALRDPEQTALRLVGVLSMLYSIISPIAWTAERIANGVVRAFGIKNAPRNPFVTEDDLRMVVNVGEREGVIEEEERTMITEILRFGDAEAHEVMVPRPDIVGVPATASVAEALDVALRAGHSRLPVYGQSIDSLEGVVYLKDLVEAVVRGDGRSLADLARPPFFIPETKKLGELLHEFQARRVHIAIVLDEYGGTAGLVTIEDLLEEIVGEIQDEYDVETPDIEETGPNHWIVNGRIGLDDLNDLLGLNLNSEDYDTLGGYITAALERLPTAGDEVQVENVRFQVLNTERRRIGRVAVTRAAPSDEEEPQDSGGTRQ